MINPNLLHPDFNNSGSVSNATAVSTIIDNVLLPNEQFYEVYSQMNEGQQHLFNFIMQYALHCKLGEKNNELPPKTFQIFLSGGAGVGKSFLIKAITEYFKRFLRYPNQNLDQPYVFVTASTWKAATGINGVTLHSAFHLPVKSGLKFYKYKEPNDKTLHMLRNKYHYLKVLIIDEIYHAKFVTIWCSFLFGVGDFLQLPSVNQKGVFMKPSKGLYRSFSGWLWEKIQLLVEIVWQSSDPDFGQLLNRVQ